MTALNLHDCKVSATLLDAAADLRRLNLSCANDLAPSAPDIVRKPDMGEIERLYTALDRVRSDTNPRTALLLDCGKRRMGQKLIEEASEVAFEGLRNRARGLVRESADLIYHLVVLWRECGIAPEEVWEEMRQRAETLGLAEKLPKRSKT